MHVQKISWLIQIWKQRTLGAVNRETLALDDVATIPPSRRVWLWCRAGWYIFDSRELLIFMTTQLKSEMYPQHPYMGRSFTYAELVSISSHPWIRMHCKKEWFAFRLSQFNMTTYLSTINNLNYFEHASAIIRNASLGYHVELICSIMTNYKIPFCRRCLVGEVLNGPSSDALRSDLANLCVRYLVYCDKAPYFSRWAAVLMAKTVNYHREYQHE